MIQELISEIVQPRVQQLFQSRPEVSAELQGNVIQQLSRSIFEGLKKMVCSSPQGFTEVAHLLAGKSTSGQTKLNDNLVADFTHSAVEKLGFARDKATEIGHSVIPPVLSTLTQRINDPNDKSVDLTSVFQSLTGSSNVAGQLQSVLDANHDGKVDGKDFFEGLKHFLGSLFGGGVSHSPQR